MILEIRNLSFGFSSDKLIINNLSFKLHPGQVYALMGSNGAGKTTLFNLINGFIKPKSGQIVYNGKRLTGLAPFKINRQGIGRTFQDLRIVSTLSVRENILLAMKDNATDNIWRAMLPKRFSLLSDVQLGDRAVNIAVQFFLNDIQDSLASEISYGQQKLLTLACCVANGAKILLLDEPVAGIQPEYRNKIAAIIKQLKEEGKTILLIEHNTDFVAEVADKIFFLHEGEISNFDSMESLKIDQNVIEAYI